MIITFSTPVASRPKIREGRHLTGKGGIEKYPLSFIEFILREFGKSSRRGR